MKKLSASLACATALMLVGIGGANATTISTTFTGTFLSGSVDTYGEFSGISGTNFVGQTFSATISYNPYSESEAFSGYSVGGGGSNLNISITSMGFTRTFNQPVQITETNQGIASGTNLQWNVNRFESSNGGYYKLVGDFYTTTNYTASALQTQAGLDAYIAGMSGWSDPTKVDGIYFVDPWGNWETFKFAFDSVQNAVPEPETLLLCGVALLGIKLRRRRG